MNKINVNEVDMLIETYRNPRVLDDGELSSAYSHLVELRKELELCEKFFIQEIKARVNDSDGELGNYDVTFKSSNLFNKSAAEQHITDIGMSDKFMSFQWDYKKLQSYVKGMDNYTKDFTKESNKRMNIKKRK